MSGVTPLHTAGNLAARLGLDDRYASGVLQAIVDDRLFSASGKSAVFYTDDPGRLARIG